MWLTEVIKCNKIIIVNVSSLSEALVHLKEENISRGAGTMKMKMMQIIKENHLPPQLHNKADIACHSPTFTVNLMNFLWSECSNIQTNVTHCLWCEVHYKRKDIMSMGFLLLILWNFYQRVYVLTEAQEVQFTRMNSCLPCQVFSIWMSLWTKHPEPSSSHGNPEARFDFRGGRG